MKFNFVNKQNRTKLEEGRNYGMGFALCKRDGKTITAAYPISPCRDYLNDEVYSERTGKPFKTYGLSSFKQDLFQDGTAYLAFAICEKMESKQSFWKHKTYAKECELIKDYKRLQKFINWFEDKFKLTQKTEIFQIEDNQYVAKSPDFWTEGTYLISLYSLLLRVGIHYIDGDPMEFLENYQVDGDAYNVKPALPKIKKMIEGSIPKQNLMIARNPHLLGIVGFSF
jgi:hypothetical protein